LEWWENKDMLSSPDQKWVKQAQLAEKHYLENSDKTHLDKVIYTWKQVLDHVDLTKLDIKLRVGLLNNIGVNYINLYEITNQVIDLNKALKYLTEACREADVSDSIELINILNNLSNALRIRYEHTGSIEDLQQTIKIARQIVEKTLSNSPNLANYLTILGDELILYYNITGDIESLEELINVSQQAVQITPEDSPYLASYLNNLGISFSLLYEYSGNYEDLEQAVIFCKQAMQKSLKNSKDLPKYLNNLGHVLSDQYEKTGIFEYLQRSINAYKQAIQKISLESAQDLASYLSNLSGVLYELYEHTGKSEDIEESIEACEKALEIADSNDYDLPRYFHNLGIAVTTLYERTGSLTSLHRGIEAFEQAVASTPSTSPDLSLYLSNLGGGLFNSYEHTGVLEYLKRAKNIYERAVQITHHNSPSLPMFFNNLGNILNALYDETEELEYLQQSADIYTQAVEKTPENSPDLSIYLNNLGIVLNDIYVYTRKIELLHKSIEVCKQAVRKTPKTAPHLASFLNNLSLSFCNLYLYTKDEKILKQSILTYKNASVIGLNTAIKSGLKSAISWLKWAFTRESWQELEQAYSYTQQASEQLFKIQLFRSDKEIWLKETQGIASKAAYAFAKNNKLEQAVVALESGLARLLSEALARDRANLEQLKTIGHADLYDHYQQIVEKWHFLTQQPEINKEALRATSDELDATISAIQQVQGFEQFLKPPTFATIQQAAQDTTLIYILTTEAGGLALLVGEKIIPVWLPALTDTDLHNILNNEDKTGYLDIYFNRKQNKKAWYTALDTTTEWLWQIVMAPIIDALPPQAKITLIPVGLLALLPLHTAWIKDTSKPTGKRYVLDDFSISYAPNALALTKAKSIVDNISSESLLAIDEPQPVQADSLPNSQYEVKTIAAQFKNAKTLEHEAASRTAVLDIVPKNRTILHFSCHGKAYLNEPLKNGLLMSNHEEITLKDILNLRLQGIRLATLSACETGMIGTQLPDEFVNFSSGLLQAGCAGVVASLWSVSNNVSSMFLMIRFYEFWRQKNLEPPEALRQAQIWVRDSSNAEKLTYLEQAIEDSELAEKAIKRFKKELGFCSKAERSFAHPYYWAAFTYTGR
jgi:CHAT domain-containing protein